MRGLLIVVFLGVIVSAWQIWYISGQPPHQEVPSSSVPHVTPQQINGTASIHMPTRATTISPPTAQTPSSSATPIAAPSPASAPGSSACYHTCAISYSSADELFVQKLSGDLKAHGVSCWLTSQDGRIDEKLRVEIYQAIGHLDKLLLVLSLHAIESQWVEEDVDAALDREHQQLGTLLLFPLCLDDTVFTTSKYWAITVRQRRIDNFVLWQKDAEYQQAFQRVLRDLHV